MTDQQQPSGDPEQPESTQPSWVPPGWSVVPVPAPIVGDEPQSAPPPIANHPGAPAAAGMQVSLPAGPAPLASMLERIIGAVIDGLIMIAPVWVVVVLLPDLLEFLAGVLVSAAYVIGFIGAKGATVGGVVMNIKCVAEDGDVPGYGRAGRRWLLLYAPGVVPVVGGLASVVVGLSPLVDNDRRMQGWHDKYAGTYVVKTGPGSPVRQEPRNW